MNRGIALLSFVLLVACSRPGDLVRPDRLAPGGGDPGGGGAGVCTRPDLEILVHMQHDSTDFDPNLLMQLIVDGTNRAPDMVIGGDYALLTLSPSPAGSHFVELLRRPGEPFVDSFTYNAQPQPVPTLLTVSPNTAMVGTQVTLTGTLLDTGTVRVFFGGVEGIVDSSNDTTILATVPAEAVPGLVFVLTGAQAAEGVVEFQPLDAAGDPVPRPTDERIFAVFPANGVVETPARVWGINFDNQWSVEFNGKTGSRVFDGLVTTLPVTGDVLSAVAVATRTAPVGPGTLFLVQGGNETNSIPFTVEAGN